MNDDPRNMIGATQPAGSASSGVFQRSHCSKPGISPCTISADSAFKHGCAAPSVAARIHPPRRFCQLPWLHPRFDTNLCRETLLELPEEELALLYAFWIVDRTLGPGVLSPVQRAFVGGGKHLR